MTGYRWILCRGCVQRKENLDKWKTSFSTGRRSLLLVGNCMLPLYSVISGSKAI